MKLPFISRRAHEEALGWLRADRERVRGERDQFLQDRNAAQTAAQTAARQFTEADKELAAVRAQLVDRVDGSTVVDTLIEHDGHRNSLAAVLGAGPDRSWEQMLAEVGMLHTELTRAKAETVALSGELDEARGGRRLVEGGILRPRTASDELRQAKAHSAALAARLAVLTTASMRCKCGGAS